ncbi:MAG: TolC family protein [Gemmatimonadota bacterium]|nr:TolC family protein [Gemmatimonadota bacterium]MDH5805647.1 TolC family protein [Gemmatimonadota bacterium]
MYGRTFAIATIITLAVNPSVASQQTFPAIPDQLSLEDALRLAEENSPTYRQAANDHAPAAWGVRNAYAAIIPQLSASAGASYTGAGSQQFVGTVFNQPSSTISSNYSLGFRWDFDGNTLLTPSVQRAALTATDATIDASLMTLRSSIIQQYLAILQAQEQVTLQEGQAERNGENLRLAQARYDVGQSTMIDVRQAEVAKGQSDVALLRAQQSVTVEKLRLFQLMGVTGPANPDNTILSDNFPIVDPTWSLEELLAEADKANPDVLALRAQESSAKWNERATKSQWLPSISVSGGWSGYTQQWTNSQFLVDRAQTESTKNITACGYQNTIHQGINSLGGSTLPILDCNTLFGFDDATRNAIIASNEVFPFNFANEPFQTRLTVSLPLFDQFNRNLRISQASVQTDDAMERRRARELQVLTDVSEQYYGMVVAHQTIAIQENNRTAAEDGLRLARERYRVGAGTFLELLEAQVQNQQAEADYIRAVFDYHRSLVALEAAVGHPLR